MKVYKDSPAKKSHVILVTRNPHPGGSDFAATVAVTSSAGWLWNLNGLLGGLGLVGDRFLADLTEIVPFHLSSVES